MAKKKIKPKKEEILDAFQEATKNVLGYNNDIANEEKDKKDEDKKD